MDWFSSYTDIIFREPKYLWFILPLVVCWGGVLFLKYTNTEKVYKDPWINMHLSGSKIPSFFSYIWFWFVSSLAMSLLVVVLAIPEQRISEKEPVYGKMRITFILDTSLSMKYAEDIPPNRLAAAKNVIRKFTYNLWQDSELLGHYSLALIPFAGGAVALYLPFTTSRDGFSGHLQDVDEKTITTAGTNLVNAFLSYSDLLDQYPARGKDTVDIAIMISDGGKEDGILIERNSLEFIISRLPKNVVLYTVGIGSVKVINHRRVPQPVRLIVRNDDGTAHYLRKEQGNPTSPVLKSTLDEEVLKTIARFRNGSYTFFEEEDKLVATFKDIVLKNRKQIDSVERAHYEPVLFEFLLPAFLLLYFLFGFHRFGFVLRIKSFFFQSRQ